MRLPNDKEKQELLEHVIKNKYVGEPTKEEIQDEKDCIDGVWVCVFEDYITDGPGYAGPIMVVVWGGSPSFVEAFIWQSEEFGGEKILTKVEIEI